MYEDWTLETIPRCFYIGKGSEERISRLKRNNKKHACVVENYGQRRIVVFETFIEQEAFDYERKMILERCVHHRSQNYNGIGCNLTLGGQGNSGRVFSKETCQKISESKRGKKSNKICSPKEKEEISKRMSLLHKGKKLSESHIEKLRIRMANAEIKNDMIQKVSKALKKKYQTDDIFRQRILETRARGEKNGRTPFTEEDVLRIRKEWNLSDKRRGQISKLCKKYSIEFSCTEEAVYSIIVGKSWKHLL